MATVLAELAEVMNGDRLAEEARRASLAWVQRLGYLLCFVEAAELAGQLDGIVAKRDAFTVALAPWKGMTGAPRDARWRVVSGGAPSEAWRSTFGSNRRCCRCC